MPATSRSLSFSVQGDKENSSFFNEYLNTLLEERDGLGLSDMVHEIDAMMLTVDPGKSIEYIEELCLMSPYHYLVTLESESHWTHVLRIDMNAPDLIIREVKNGDIKGIFRSLNEVFPIGSSKPHSRYMGEILRVSNLHEVVKLQQRRGFLFFSPDEVRKLELPGNMAITKPSPYTHNIVAYVERKAEEPRVYALGVSSIRSDAQSACERAKQRQKAMGIGELPFARLIDRPVKVVPADGRP